MSEWTDQLAGKFIVFDGPDGSGKSTQFSRFAAHCRDRGLSVREVREPGGTTIGERIREVLLDPAHTEMQIACEMLLYMASRAQLIEQVVAPALQRGEFVLADRFISSTLAYQGTAGGLSRKQIMEVGAVAVGDCWPDLVIVFDVDERTAGQRLSGSRGASEPTLFSDRMELKQSSFRERVRQGYLEQVREAEAGTYLLIDASPDEDTVFETLLAGLRQRFAPAASH